MPPTRASAAAGPSRLRYSSQAIPTSPSQRRHTRRTASQSEASGSEDHHLEASVAFYPRRGLKRDGSSKSHLAVPTVDREVEATPRARSCRHTRTTSLASTSTLIPPTPSGLIARRRPHVRPSLTGAQVEELTIERRAEVVADIAGDCLLRLVRAGARGDGKVKKGDEEWRRAWDGLQTLKSTYIFPDYSPPFPLLTDLISSFHPHVQSTLNPASLARALNLSNLATFVFTILRPDEAGDILEDDEDVLEGAGTSHHLADLGRIKRRARVLLLAWKKFWMVVVPRERRSSEKALRLWLDFATQIQLVGQHYSVDPIALTHSNLMLSFEQIQLVGQHYSVDPPSPDPSIPPPPPTQVQDLFSPSAIGRYGQWEIGEDWSSETDGDTSGVKGNVERRWGTLSRRREKELRDLAPEVLERRYPYDVFRQEMLAFIQRDILGSIAYLQISPRHSVTNLRAEISQPGRSDIVSTASGYQALMADNTFLGDGLHGYSESSTSDERDLLPDHAQFGEQNELDAAESSLGEEEDDAPLELDMFAEIAMELEHDTARLSPQRRPHRSVSAAVQKNALAEPGDHGGDEWTVRDYQVTGDARIPQVTHQPLKFNFAAPQASAVRVGWESQSPAHSRTSVTPRAAVSAEVPALVQGTPRSIVRSPRFGMPSRTSEPTQTPASALRLQHARASPRSPSSLPRRIFQPRRSDTATLPPLPRVSLNPGADLIAIHATRTRSVSDHSAIEDDEAEEAEVLEEPEVQDLLPDTAQLQGHFQLSTDEPRTPPDADIGELLPGSSQLKGEQGVVVMTESVDLQGLGMDIFDQCNDDVVAFGYTDNNEVRNAELENVPEARLPRSRDSQDNRHVSGIAPTSQRAIVSTRPRESREGQDFASPNPDEEQEDRQLLREARTPRPKARASWRTANSVKRSPCSPDILRAPVPRLAGRAASRARESTGEDPYLVDVDGSPLTTDPKYVVPRQHTAERSRIHGQVGDQKTAYSRISGRRKWSKAEEILLYRTVQKVPTSDEYPLRVVWFLHGEYGTLSHNLEQFNPQHMKDKMRVIVNARVNNRRPVTGRARFFLPGDHPDKLAYTKEMDALRKGGQTRFPTVVSEEDERESDAVEVDLDEKNDYLDELASEKEEVRSSPVAMRTKRTRAGRSAAQQEPVLGEGGDEPEEQSTPTPKRTRRTRAAAKGARARHGSPVVEIDIASTSRRSVRSREASASAPLEVIPAGPTQPNDRALRYAVRNRAAAPNGTEVQDTPLESEAVPGEEETVRMKTRGHRKGKRKERDEVEQDLQGNKLASQADTTGPETEADDGEDLVRREMVKRRVLGIGALNCPSSAVIPADTETSLMTARDLVLERSNNLGRRGDLQHA